MTLIHFGIVLALWVSGSGAITYTWKQTPERVPYDDSVTIDFTLRDFSEPLGQVHVRSAVGAIFNVSENGRCETQTSNHVSGITLRLCESGKYRFQISNLRLYFDLWIVALDQTPNKSETYIMAPYRIPNGIGIHSLRFDPRKVNAGSQVTMSCKFKSGSYNFGYFSWDRVNISKSMPSNAVYEAISRPAGKPENYGRENEVSWRAEPGDEGWYQCHAVYNPRSVGEFTSNPVYVNVTYSPQLDVEKGYDMYKEAAIGENVTLAAPIMANPAPSEIRWLKDGEELTEERFLEETVDEFQDQDGGQEQHSLAFTVQDDDYGLYQCLVVNDVGRGSLYFRLAPAKLEPFNTWKAAAIALIAIFFIVLLVAVVFVILFIRNKHSSSEPKLLPEAPRIQEDNPAFQSDEPDNTPVEAPEQPMYEEPAIVQPQSQRGRLPPPPPPGVNKPPSPTPEEDIYMNDVEVSRTGFQRLAARPLSQAHRNEGVPTLNEDNAGYMEMTRGAPIRR